MRYKPEQKEETHQKILELASKEFRAHGFEGVGIAKLMTALGLTHGGFYAHFAEKEDLVAESLLLALSQSLDSMLATLEAGGLTAMVDLYLSEAHRDESALGCPLPALAAEVARRSPSLRTTFTEKLSQTFDTIAEHIPGTTSSQKQAKVQFMFAAMAGAVSLARATSDPSLSKSILESTRNHLIHLFQE